MEDNPNLTIEQFSNIVKETTTEEERLEIVRKYIFHGIPHIFNNKAEAYYDFRNLIARQFNVGFHEVFIVGSAKLGYSYMKKTPFDIDSDIDVVIVNEKLFEYYLNEICRYQYSRDAQYHSINIQEKKVYEVFLQYIVKGWMRPDKLPYSFQIDELKSSWFDFFNSISNGHSNVGNYKVTAGLFKNYEYIEKYYSNSIEKYFKTL